KATSSLKQAAFDEAQQKDDAATRASSDNETKAIDGKRLFINELSGDFRDSGSDMCWHFAACKHFGANIPFFRASVTDSCGLKHTPLSILAEHWGRQPSRSLVVDEPMSIRARNVLEICLAVTANHVLDQASCEEGDAAQLCTFEGTAKSTQGVH
ncbi:Mg2+ transporter protein, partial [Diplocarpon rosae]